MGRIVPDAVERYLASLNRHSDAVLLDIARSGEKERLPLIDAEVGALLRVLVSTTGARRVLEIGTAVGYSGIWIARALPADGMLLTMERDPARVKAARSNFERAGVASRVHVMTGDAGLLVNKVSGPFDLIFQDGSKQQYVAMLDRLITLLRPGGLLVTDNVLWDGEVVPDFIATPQRDAADTAAIADYNRRLSGDPRLTTAIVPLRDGVAISVRHGG